MRGLEDPFGDPERDAIDEQPLPQRERRGRRLLEAREVLEVAAEGVPPLCLECGVLLRQSLRRVVAPRSIAAFTNAQKASASRTTSLQRG